MFSDKVNVHLNDIVKKDDVYLPVDATFKQLLSVMNRNTKGAVVLLQDDKPAGILTERDVVQMMYYRVKMDDPIYYHAQKKLIHTSGRRCIGYAMNLMIENNIRRLIVTNDDGSFLGIVTRKIF